MNINQIRFQVLLIFGVCVLSQATQAQVFEIKNASKRYDVKMTTNCMDNSCDGQANIDLYLKGTTQHFQHFSSAELTMDLDETYKPSVNVVQLYGEQSALILLTLTLMGVRMSPSVMVTMVPMVDQPTMFMSFIEPRMNFF